MLVVLLDLVGCDLALGFPSVIIRLAVLPVYQVVGDVVDEFMANDLIDLCFVVLCFLCFWRDRGWFV